MHILFLSTDRNLLTSGSSVYARFARFAAMFPTDCFTSIVFSLRAHGVPLETNIGSNMRVQGTASRSRLQYGWDAMGIARNTMDIDVVSAQDPFETGLAAYFIARRKKVPYVVEIHTDFFTPLFTTSSVLNRIRIHIARFVLRHAAAVYVVAPRLKDQLAGTYPSAPRAEVLPIFVDTGKYRALPRTPTRGSMLWVGRMTHEKQPALAVEAVSYARSKGHDINLVLLGDGPLMPKLKQLVRERGIQDHVSFAGWQDPSLYLSNAELLLVTSAYEGYGLVIVEALAAGVPVLSTPVGIAAEAGANIASDNYGESLCAWLNGPRERAELQGYPYKDEQDYFTQTRCFYARVAGDREG